jgi:hypothetical protein
LKLSEKHEEHDAKTKAMAEDIHWKRGQTLDRSHIPDEIIELVRTQLADWAKVVSQVCEEVREVQGTEKTPEFLETSAYRVLRSEISREKKFIMRLIHKVFAERGLEVWVPPEKVYELQHTVPNLMKMLKRDIQIEANELKYRKRQAQQATESPTPRARSRRGRGRLPFKETRELDNAIKEAKGMCLREGLEQSTINILHFLAAKKNIPLPGGWRKKHDIRAWADVLRNPEWLKLARKRLWRPSCRTR